MKKILLSIVATTLALSTSYGMGTLDLNILNKKISEMAGLSFKCLETARSEQTKNSVLICEKTEDGYKKVRLFKVEYMVLNKGSRCAGAAVSQVTEI